MENQAVQTAIPQVPQSTQQQLPTKPKRTYIKILATILGVILIAGAIYGVYAWQHHKVNELNSQLDNYQATLVKDSKISLNNLNASKSASSANQSALSSSMPQTQFSNPEFAATLNYLSCLNNPGDSSKITGSGTSATCSSGAITYPAPTFFTYAMITNYSWLPESADTTFVNLAEQNFQFCSSSQGSGIGGADEVDYSNASFVIFTYDICGDAKTGLYQNKNGIWTRIANASAGGPPASCSPYSADNIPENVLKYNAICQ